MKINMTNEEEYLANRWYNEWHSPLMMVGKKLIIIDKDNNRTYLIYSNGNGNISILKKSKKYKKLISQFKNLFPEIDFNTSEQFPFKFIHFFENIPNNEIIIGVNNNKIISGGFGIYEV